MVGLIKLDPYQVESSDFLAERTRALLLDEQGVGKTYPTIRAAKDTDNGYPWLVTAPAYLLPTWRKCIREMHTYNDVAIANGTPKQRLDALTSGRSFVLTSYNNWTSEQYSSMWTGKWNYAFDEIHRIRGRNSKWTKQILKAGSSRNVFSKFWGLTGTPMVRDPGDLFPLLKLMDPQSFTSYWKFVGQWCDLRTTPWATEVGQLKEGVEGEFWEMVRRYSLRRSTQDVPELRDLTHTYNEVLVDLPASVVKTCKDAVKNYVIEHPDIDTPEAVSSGGALVQKLRQMTTVPPTKTNPKLDALMDLLEDHQEPVIVWCWYRATANAIMDRLESNSRPAAMFTGDTSAKGKEINLQWFYTSVSDNENPIMVATISAMKEGVNMQAARTQIFMEESYLPADNAQAIARSKRRGQTKPVNVYHIHASDSIDIKVHSLQENRESGILRAMLEHIRKDFS